LEWKNIINKGIIETDAVIAFFVVLLMVFLMINSLNFAVNKNQETKNLFYLKTKAIYFADSLVKNSNQEKPEKGIAVYNKEKKRVEENVIDLNLVEKIDEENFPELLKEIRIEFEEKEIRIGEKKGNCFEARRLVMMETGEKGVVFVYACN